MKYWLVWLICLLVLTGCTITRPGGSRGLTVNEYLLSAPPDISTDRLVYHFAAGDQEAVLARTALYRDYFKQVNEYNSPTLSAFGYSLRDHTESGQGDSPSYSKIYHGDQLVADHVVFIKPISVNASGTDFISLVDMPDGTYTFTRDRFEKRAWPPAREPYVYVGD